jgi:hypothetical protein
MHMLVPACMLVAEHSEMLSPLYAVCSGNYIGWFEYYRSLSCILSAHMLDRHYEVALDKAYLLR